MSDRFEICWPYTLAQECPFPKDWSNPKNFSNDKHDPGGETMNGIIQREYDTYRHLKGLEPQDVRNITRAEGEEIYRGYWKHCELLPPGLDMTFFDTAVNMGRTRATKILQFVLGIPYDGLWGPQTAKAVAAITDVVSVIDKYTEHREATYKILNGWQYFGKGWTARDVKIGKISDSMAAGQPAPPPAPRPAPAPTPVPQPVPRPAPQPRGPTTMSTIDEIETALQAAEQFLPELLGVLGMFYPPAAMLAKFLPLLPVALQAVNTVSQVTGQPAVASMGTVVNHLTPGQPNSPALTGANATP
jgi:lysozyme family protein